MGPSHSIIWVSLSRDTWAHPQTRCCAKRQTLVLTRPGRVGRPVQLSQTADCKQQGEKRLSSGSSEACRCVLCPKEAAAPSNFEFTIFQLESLHCNHCNATSPGSDRLERFQ
jgi:hypothetical protein